MKRKENLFLKINKMTLSRSSIFPIFQMSRRGGGSRGRMQKKDVWDVEGGYMGMKKQKLEEQFKEQV